MKNDIFEKLMKKVGCEYLSDMKHRPWTSYVAKKTLSKMSLREYDLCALNDVCSYLYAKREPFATKKEAVKFIRSFDVANA